MPITSAIHRNQIGFLEVSTVAQCADQMVTFQGANLHRERICPRNPGKDKDSSLIYLDN